MDTQLSVSDFSLESAISTVIKIPGIKVNRNKYLAEIFGDDPAFLQEVLEKGPIEAGVDKDRLSKIAKKQIMFRTSESSIASFLAGLPGGLAMAATIPADIAQFFAITLRIAQELSYLYGAQDLWENGEVDDERVRSQLILYCGVMFGVSGASSGVRVLSAQIAKTTLKKLPQKALTKTFWYPIIKKIGQAIGVKITKTTVAQGLNKAIPVVGGVISGGLTFASMLPMANRLQTTLEQSSFDYTDEDLEADIIEIENIANEEEPTERESAKEKLLNSANDAKTKITGVFGKLKKSPQPKGKSDDAEDAYQRIEKLLHLKEIGAISEEEYDSKKNELLNRI